MKLHEYQSAALATAEPRGREQDYLIPMIMGEAGEALGHRAKAYWHGTPDEELAQELILEYGDVCWGAAILLHELGITEVEPYPGPNTPTSTRAWAEKVPAWSSVLNRAVGLFNLWEDSQEHHIADAAVSLWQALEYRCQACTGVELSTVLEANVAKLAGRAERGTLRGNGDHR